MFANKNHGYREEAMRIASVEQIELGNIMELSVMGSVLKRAGTVLLSKADGWKVKTHSHLTVARRTREKTKPSLPVVTIREARCIDSAACEIWSQCSSERTGANHHKIMLKNAVW